jgi:hypothetical protein
MPRGPYPRKDRSSWTVLDSQRNCSRVSPFGGKHQRGPRELFGIVLIGTFALKSPSFALTKAADSSSQRLPLPSRVRQTTTDLDDFFIFLGDLGGLCG